MVARITTGKNIRGLLSYNENKLIKGSATLIHSNGFPAEVNGLSILQKYNWFDKRIKLNSRTKTNTVHISLNFSVKDKLENSDLAYIAKEYMDRIGFGNQPYIVYRHYDTAHPHIHLVTTNIDEKGKRIETHNLGKNQSEKARKDLEVELNLVRAEDQEKQIITLKPLVKAEYGVAESRALISNIVTEVMRTYKYTSLAEFNAALRQYNIKAFTGTESSRMYQRNGLVYSILDHKGNRKGVHLKASSLYSKPLLSRLEKRFDLNRNQKLSLKSAFTDKVGKILEGVINNNGGIEDFEGQLKKQAIFISLIYNSENRLYGVTYVDNLSRTVYKGSELGKGFSANGLSQQFSKTRTDEHTKKNFFKYAKENLSGVPLEWKISDSLSIKTPSSGILNCMVPICQNFLMVEQVYSLPNLAKNRKRKKKKKRT
ncbi:MAG TPA: relaxase/mobilization nuclease domain-containing protein [Anditalea sp.]|nr:relaxase/mobilization nuclease domain-containing protein [Anditalea sp.]